MKHKVLLAVASVFLAVLRAAAPSFAQEQVKDQAAQEYVVRAITLAVTVQDGKGRFVNNLAEKDFGIYETNRNKPLTYFMHDFGSPLSLTVLLDVSGSMALDGKLDECKAALRQLAEKLLRPRDEIALLVFADGPVRGRRQALDRQSGIYFSLGPNQGHRIGHFTEALGDRPFWWVSADGADSVLTWSHGAGYSLFHTGLGYTQLRRALDEENIFRYLDQLAANAYPYDLTVLRYNIGSDNGPPDPLLPEAVRAWNERYASPRLVISSVPQAFRAFEAKYGVSLPVLRGDLTGHWEDGVQSTARETAALRRTAESLQQTEDLAALWGVTLPADTST